MILPFGIVPHRSGRPPSGLWQAHHAATPIDSLPQRSSVHPLTRKMTLSLLELPFDTLHLIIQHTSREDLSPLAYGSYPDTLLSLSLVSKSFHQLATLFLYSSIRVPTKRIAQSLRTTAKENPQLLQLCHSLIFSGSLTDEETESEDVQVEQDILSSTSGLRRFILLGHKLDTELILPSHDTIQELGYPHQFLEDIGLSTLHSFVNLERLILGYISSFHEPEVVDAFLSMKQLAYLVVCRLTPKQMYDRYYQSYYGIDESIITSIVRLLTHPRLRLTIWGWTPAVGWIADWGTFGRQMITFRDRIVALLPDEKDQAKVVFLMYGIYCRHKRWLIDRVVDGTIWRGELADDGVCC
jgi:hypothetical protein